MKTLSKSALRIAELEKQNAVMNLALSDLTSGCFKWFQGFNYALGVSRATSACGGLVLVKVVGAPTYAAYFEEFAQAESAHIAAVITGHDTECNRSLAVRRAVLEEARAWVSQQQKAA